VQALILAVITTGILGVLAGALTLLQPEFPSSNWYGLWQAAVWLVIAVDLGYAAQGLNPTTTSSFYDRRTANADYFRVYWPENVEETLKFKRFLPFDDYQVVSQDLEAFRTSGLANLNLIDRTTLLNNFDPLLVGSFAQYIDLVEKNPVQRDKLLQAAGVGAIYDDQGLMQPLEQPSALAWFVPSACWHSDESSLIQAMLDPAWDPTQQVHLLGEGDCPAPTDNDLAFQPINTLPENGVVFSQPTGQAGWLVIADTYYPGWSASEGAADVPIYRANLTFRAIQVDSKSPVQMDYHPWWIWPGVLVSITSLLIMLVLFRSKSPGSNG
jgi:hypothetical protein